jgi:NhaP-type Na+/H+ or K+/H+ antiporter
MTVMWLVTSLLVFAFVPHISFLQALAVGACVTPTDPVLSNSIVKGKVGWCATLMLALELILQ